MPLLVRHERGAEAGQREGQPFGELALGPLPAKGRAAAAAETAQHAGRRRILSQLIAPFHDVKVPLPHGTPADEGRAMRALAHLAVAMRDGLNARSDLVADGAAQALALVLGRFCACEIGRSG